MEQERSKVREKLSSTNENYPFKQSLPQKKSSKAEDFHIGDAVRVLSLNLNGNREHPAQCKGDLFVQMEHPM